jgi:hypothetical protein
MSKFFKSFIGFFVGIFKFFIGIISYVKDYFVYEVSLNPVFRFIIAFVISFIIFFILFDLSLINSLITSLFNSISSNIGYLAEITKPFFTSYCEDPNSNNDENKGENNIDKKSSDKNIFNNDTILAYTLFFSYAILWILLTKYYGGSQFPFFPGFGGGGGGDDGNTDGFGGENTTNNPTQTNNQANTPNQINTPTPDANANVPNPDANVPGTDVNVPGADANTNAPSTDVNTLNTDVNANVPGIDVNNLRINTRNINRQTSPDNSPELEYKTPLEYPLESPSEYKTPLEYPLESPSRSDSTSTLEDVIEEIVKRHSK